VTEPPPFNIAAAFKNKEAAMRAAFLAIRNVTTHPTTRGDQSEADWVGLIRDFLPTRYAVGPIFAVDCHGSMSQQIDAAVYDTHFSPQWFGAAGGVRFVPVESVYAVFEVKPQFDSRYLGYAREKVASVRSLERTSYSVVHKGGTYERAEIQLRPIIGGILTTRPDLKDPIAKLLETQPAVDAHEFLNIGICLDEFTFDYTPSVDGDSVSVELTTCADGNQLIHFAIRLFRQLQAVGTVPAVDMTMYECNVFPPSSVGVGE
jgi:hypothetical protein